MPGGGGGHVHAVSSTIRAKETAVGGTDVIEPGTLAGGSTTDTNCPAGYVLDGNQCVPQSSIGSTYTGTASPPATVNTNTVPFASLVGIEDEAAKYEWVFLLIAVVIVILVVVALVRH